MGHLNGEVFVNQQAWDSVGDDIRAIVTEITRATSAEAAAHFLYRDILFKEEFVSDFDGELVQLDDDAMAALTSASLEVVDEFSEQDPNHSARLGEMLHEYLRTLGKV